MIIGLQNSDTCWTESKVKSLPLIDSSKFSWYLERSDSKSSSTASFASLEDIIFILSLLECITRSSSSSCEEIKLIAIDPNNPEISSTTKIDDYITCGYSMSKIWAFDHIEKKHTLYCGKDCIRKFCTSLREHANNAIDFEKKKNVTVNKKRTKITSGWKSMLYVQKENIKNLL